MQEANAKKVSWEAEWQAREKAEHLEFLKTVDLGFIKSLESVCNRSREPSLEEIEVLEQRLGRKWECGHNDP
jgi:hypothetical protein